jgi:hypothetical protein
MISKVLVTKAYNTLKEAKQGFFFSAMELMDIFLKSQNKIIKT